MRRVLTTLAVALVLAAGSAACSDTSDLARPDSGTGTEYPGTISDTAETSATEPADPASPADIPADEPSHRDLVLESPAAGSAISANPLMLRGRARTFENNVFIRLLDSQGRLMTTAVTTARGDMGNLNPFETEVWLTRDPGAHVVVELVEHSAKDGSVRAVTRRRLPFNGELRQETLFFPVENPGSDCTRTITVTRQIPATPGRIRVLVEALIAGPTDREMTEYDVTSPFPEGARVEGVNLTGARAVVDFNERMVNVGGSCRVAAIRSAVERTLTNLEGVDSVEIRANGSADQALQP